MIRRLLRRLTGRSTPPTPAPRPAPPPAMPQPSTSPAPSASPGASPHLVLYKYDACPYCRRVQNTLAELPFHVELRDTRLDASARAELQQRTGRTQVPCLFIDGTPLFESADIIAWLHDHARTRQ